MPRVRCELRPGLLDGALRSYKLRRPGRPELHRGAPSSSSREEGGAGPVGGPRLPDHFSGVDRSDLSFFKSKYQATNYEPKNTSEWEDCATKYIHAIKQCHPKENLSHDLELFSRLVGEKKVEIDDLAKFSQVTFVYFLLRKDKSLNYTQNEISKLIPKDSS